jgi:heme/copper-type cytochrome/quinol oxidase subunit 3
VPPLFNPVPDLPLPTAELILIVLSCIPMYWTDMAARRDDARRVKIGLTFMFLVAATAVTLRFFEMQQSHLKFRWDDNAYGSVIWVILGLHLTYLLAAMLEFFIMGAWVFRHGLDFKHGLDVTLAGGYWYWTAGTWVLCYLTVYFGARWL